MVVPSPYAAEQEAMPGRRCEITIDQATTAYWVYGPESAAITIVAIHGFRGDHHGLEPIFAQLPDARIIAPDLPGFGASEPMASAQHDVEGYGRWLADFCGSVAPPNLIVLGHSFGSIVVAAALAAGLSADRAVLINPIAAPALSGPRAILSRIAVGYYQLGAILPERLGHALLASRPIVRGLSALMAKTRDRKLRRWIHDQHRRYFSAFANRNVVLESFQASVSRDVSQYAEAIGVPVLLIGADRDDITSPEDQLRLVRGFVNAESKLIMISDTGHLIHYEAPRAAAAAIQAFCSERR